MLYFPKLHFKRQLLIVAKVFLLLLTSSLSNAQVLQVEGFESTIFPAPGWRQIKALTASNGAFTPQTAALTNPTTTPAVGAKVMIFNSASAVLNDTAFMVSKPFDFSSCGATNPTFSFQMYRDNGFSSAADEISVFMNTSPSIVGATAINHGGGTNKILRYNGINGWNTYTFTLNAATYNAGPKKAYIILVGVAKGGNNIYIDNFRVNTFPSPTVTGDVSMNVVQQNFASVGLGATSQWIIGVRCIVASGSGCGNLSLGTAVKLDEMLFNTNGTTNVNDIQNARVWYTGGSQQFSTGYLSPFPAGGYPSATFGSIILTPGTNLDFTNPIANPCFHLEYDTSYFWLTYDVKPTATGGNNLDGDFRGAAVTPGGGACPTPLGNSTTVPVTTNVFEIPGGPQIGLPYCIPTYTVGTAWSGYNNNDYVHNVDLIGDAPTLIATGVNTPSLQPGVCGPAFGCHFVAHPPDYELWPTRSGTTVNLTQGQPYQIKTRAGTYFSGNYIQAWIDYNRDADFNDPGERIGSVPLTNLTGLQQQTFNFIVPAAGYTGPTRLRVREVFANSNPDPCLNYTYGECEDFNINIIPNCPAGYKLWLGNNSNWNDPANWCGGIPTSADSTVLDKAQVPGLTSRTYFAAVINSAVKANTRSLFISSSDTLNINAPSPADTALRIHGTLYNNGRFNVVSSFSSAFTISTGTLDNSIYTPFRGSVTDSRCQIMYSAAELTAQGMVANEQITQIGFAVNTKASSQPFSGFTISYGFQPGATVQFANNTPLATPTTVYGPVAFSTVSGPNMITLSTPIIWDGTSALVIQYCFDNPASNFNDLIKITQTTGRKTVLLLTTTTNVAPGCALVPGVGVTDNFFLSAGINRPNFTFYTDRISQKPWIGLKGDWNNNGGFLQGNSIVIMDSSGAQNILGNSTTTFHELEIKKTAIANTVTLQRPIIVEDTLYLSQGQLVMNKKEITIKNSAATNTNTATAGLVTTLLGPISRTNGIIISEDSLSKVNWTIGQLPASAATNGLWRAIPFGRTDGSYIPFSFHHKNNITNNSDLGTFTVATYGTPVGNTPWPPSVSHMNYTGVFVTNNASAAVDRFWITSKSTTGPATTDFCFRWTSSERATVVPVFNILSNPPRPYPWRVSPNNIGTWLRIYSTPNTSGAPISTDSTYTSSAIFSGAIDSLRLASFDWPNVLAGAAPLNATAGPMPTTLPWAIAGSSASGALGTGGLGFTVSITSNNPATCPGVNDGAINITASAGTAPYSFLWNDGVTTEDRSAISAGTYTVTATDAAGATASLQVTVANQSSIPIGSGQIIGSSSICPGNTAKYYLSGITGATNYNWVITTPTPNASILSGQGTDTIIVLFNSSFISLQLCATPSNSCGSASAVCKMIDNQGFAETVNANIEAVSCFGGNDGSITITLGNDSLASKNPGLVISEIHPDPSGNDSPFEWVELVATDYINFNTTPYTIVFSNNGTATSKGWFQGGIPSPPPTNSTYAFAINSGSVSPGQIVYVGGSQMTPTGTKLRTINTATTAGDGGIGGAFLSSGVLGNGGGVADGVAVFKKSVSLIDSTTYPVDAVFFGTGIGVAAFSDTSAGFTLPTSDIYPGGHLRSNSFCAPEILGFYSITASGTFKQELGGFVSPRVFSTNSSTWSSATTGISVISNSYSWSNGSIGNSINGLSAGTYTVSITTPDGCSTINSYTVTQPAVLSISNNIVNSSCPLATNGSITTTVAGGVSAYSYQWSNGATTTNINSLTAGIYTLTVTDANGCTKTQQATVLSGTNFPTVSLTNNSPICALGINGTISSTVAGGSTPYTYLWSNGATVTNINGLTSGTYSLTVTDNNGCSATTNSTLTELAPITIGSFTPAATNAEFPVEIKGVNFSLVSQVLFNTIASPSFQKFGDTLIIATVPNNSGSGPITLINTNGCTGSSSTSFTYLTDFSKLTLKLYLQGFYFGNGFMNLPLVNTGITGDGISVDTVEVELRDPDNSNASVVRKKSVLKSNGFIEFEFPGYCLGNDYWIIVRTRNHLETWSKQPVVFELNTYFNFTNTLQFPVVITSSVTMQSSTSVTAGGNVLSDGGTPVTSRGVCWSLNPNPTIALPTKVSVGAGLGAFSTTVTGLTAGTTYYLRAFATSAVGTSYGNEFSFTTLNLLTDIDGNAYDTVVIGTQVWMSKNLRVSKYRNGDPIPTNLNNTDWQNSTSGAYAIYNNTTSNDSIYGKLYNWYAVADPRGLCPVGWHVPSDAEWTILENFLGGSSVAGGKMKSVSPLWASPNTGATNSSGFSGLPGGYRYDLGTYYYIGDSGFWWSSTQVSTSSAWNRYLYYNNGVVSRDYLTKRNGFSVRCVRD
jgi:uncharacterized protein (TIGR02145 family)